MDGSSFYVNWTVVTYADNYTVLVTGPELRSPTTIMNSYIVKGLNNAANYTVTVVAMNNCGMKRSDPMTVFSKSVYTYIHTYIHTYIC